MDSMGVWHEEDGEMEAIILDYFKSIFSSDYWANFNESLRAIEERISQEMNNELLKEFMPEEVWRALKQVHPTKSPSPNGMSPIFYQKYQDIVRPCVLNYVLQALNSGIMTSQANDTYICLISKTKNPPKNYRVSPN